MDTTSTALPNPEKPKSIDFSSHLNTSSKNRYSSPLKDIMHYMALPGMISFAGGLPHPSLFPFSDLSVSAFPANSDLSVDATPTSNLTHIQLQKYAADKQQLDLQSVLQYGYANGFPTLRAWLADWTREVYDPATSDWEILLHTGNTDAWHKLVRQGRFPHPSVTLFMLCEPGDLILCEEYTFASAMAMWASLGCRSTPVKMDGSGLRADDLERVLSNWDTDHPNEKRPRLLYIVPVGSNPTGSTMPAERRQQIYDVCVRYDVIIAEDDPYSALQFPPFEISEHPEPPQPKTGEEFKQSLVPSFLKFDVEGRVVRLESFSKTLAPGNRLGFFVANPLFTERLLRATEVETQTPSGWSQGIIYELLRQWGTGGYLQWLSNLRDVYQTRRDTMCAALAQCFLAVPASQYATGIEGAEGIALYPAGTDRKSIKADELPIASFVAPTGGMFLWIRHYLSGARRFRELEAQEDVRDPEKAFMDELWAALAENLVLLTPGSYYVPFISNDKVTTRERGAEEKIGYMRFAFSMTTLEAMFEGIKRYEEVVKRFWEY